MAFPICCHALALIVSCFTVVIIYEINNIQTGEMPRKNMNRLRRNHIVQHPKERNKKCIPNFGTNPDAIFKGYISYHR